MCCQDEDIFCVLFVLLLLLLLLSRYTNHLGVFTTVITGSQCWQRLAAHEPWCGGGTRHKTLAWVSIVELNGKGIQRHPLNWRILKKDNFPSPFVHEELLIEERRTQEARLKPPLAEDDSKTLLSNHKFYKLNVNTANKVCCLRKPPA